MKITTLKTGSRVLASSPRDDKKELNGYKLFLSVLLLTTKTFALTLDEIPEITIYPPKHTVNYKTSSILNYQNQVHIISADQITTSGAQSLTDILNSKDGIQTMELSGRPVISMRGFGETAASNTLILLNGQPYTNPDMGPSAINTIPISEIEQIEVIPGSGSILYGDQAVGGIINIITKPPQNNTNKTTLASGNFSTNKAQFNLGGVKENNFGYRLGGSIYTSNNYRDHNAERTNNFDLDLTYQEAYFRYRKINQHLEMAGRLSAEQVAQNPRQTENNIAHNNQDQDIFQLGLRHYLSPNWFADLDFTTRLMHCKGAYALAYNTPQQQIVNFNETRQTVVFRPKISGTVDFKKYSILPILGMDLNYGKYGYNSSSYNSQNTQSQGAVYGQFTIPLTTKVSAILGSRYGLAFYKLPALTSKQSKPINRALITSIELSWQQRNGLSLFIRRAENYRFPKTDEIVFTSNAKPLQTQTGVSYESGFNYKNKNFTSSITIYQLNLKNEILFVETPTAINYGGYNTNLDPTRRNGAIIDLSFDINKYLQLNTNYNFVSTKFLSGNFTGKKIPFVASNNLRLAAIFKPQDNLQLLIESIYTGKRYKSNDMINEAGQLGGYTIYNCGINYDQPHYTLTLRSNNLTNKLYYGYALVAYNGTQDTSWYYPASGRNILATLTLKL